MDIKSLLQRLDLGNTGVKAPIELGPKYAEAMLAEHQQQGLPVMPAMKATATQAATQETPQFSFTPDQLKEMNKAMDKNHTLDVVTPDQEKKVQVIAKNQDPTPQATQAAQPEQKSWVQDLMGAIPGIAKGFTEFAGKPEGFKTFAALNSDPYMKEALLNRGNEMEKTQTATTAKDRDTKIALATEFLKTGTPEGMAAGMKMLSEQGIKLAEGASLAKPVAPEYMYMNKPVEVKQGKFLYKDDSGVQQEVTDLSKLIKVGMSPQAEALEGSYILPGETTPRPLRRVGAKLYDPQNNKEVTSLAKVYKAPEKDTNRDEKLEIQLRGQFNGLPQVQEFRKVQTAYNRLRSTENTPAGDISLIFSYMKLLDPTSVVREGEFATAQNATGVPGQVSNMYNKALQGTRLTPSQRKDFMSQAVGLYNGSLDLYNSTADEYQGLAASYDLIPEQVAPKYAPVSLPKSAAPKPTTKPEIVNGKDISSWPEKAKKEYREAAKTAGLQK